uniref:Recep_L_domain domain-containing protein n=1 Tax=Caenorhabditis japonica TaxID=281687 RepID=A0A8R1DPT3_CAEJA
MLSKVLIAWPLLFAVLIVPIDAIVKCNGSELSARSDFEVGLLTEKQCTHVIGDIFIMNLNFAKRMPCYWSVREVHGSIIIRNTSNLGDSVNFQNLRTINALDAPALVISKNYRLKLGIGARLGHVYTRNPTTYYIAHNWPRMMTESQHYTLYNAAAKDRPVFFADYFFQTTPCAETAYKTLAAIFGCVSFLVAIVLIFWACYGRRPKDLKY